MVSMQHRHYTVEIHADGAWLIVAEKVTRAKALEHLKGLEAEGWNVRLWSEVEGGRS
jgi:hypothetical protein